MTSPVATPWDTAPVAEAEALSERLPEGKPGCDGEPQFTTENKRPIEINVIERLVIPDVIFRLRSLRTIDRRPPFSPVPVKRTITKTVNVKWIEQVLTQACSQGIPLTACRYHRLRDKRRFRVDR
jgi:hypothetical protein